MTAEADAARTAQEHLADLVKRVRAEEEADRQKGKAALDEHCSNLVDELVGGKSSKPPVSDVWPPPDRPTIEITTELERDADAGIAALARDPNIYQRSGALVHVTHDDDVADARAPVAKDSPIIHDMAAATLLERLSSCAKWTKKDSRAKKQRQTLPSSPIVSAVYARKEWAGIRTLVGVITSPTMRPDGSIVQRPGYDAKTGYLYEPNAYFPEVRVSPTREDAVASLAVLTDLFVNFPFTDEAARLVPIAALLTLLARPAIRGAVPCFGFDSPTRGTGKGLAGSVPVEIATGRAAPLATFPATRNGQEELEKMLGAYALSGAPVIFFDNIPIGHSFGGAPLEKVLTAADTVSLRILGQSKTPTLPWRAVVFVAGNNLLIADETARRVLVARMVSDVERPEERTGFKYPELLEHVRAERSNLVVHGLTILRSYVVHGSPDTGGLSLGNYEAWSKLIPRAIQFAGGADVLNARVTLTGDTDADATTHTTILEHLPRLIDGAAGGMTAHAILAALYPLASPHVPRSPDGYEELRAALESATGTRPGTRPATQKLGTYFRNIRDRKVAGHTLFVVGTHAGTIRWGVR